MSIMFDFVCFSINLFHRCSALPPARHGEIELAKVDPATSKPWLCLGLRLGWLGTFTMSSHSGYTTSMVRHIVLVLKNDNLERTMGKIGINEHLTVVDILQAFMPYLWNRFIQSFMLH